MENNDSTNDDSVMDFVAYDGSDENIPAFDNEDSDRNANAEKFGRFFQNSRNQEDSEQDNSQKEQMKGSFLQHSKESGGDNSVGGNAMVPSANDSTRDKSEERSTETLSINKIPVQEDTDDPPSETLLLLEQEYERISSETQACITRQFEQLANYVQISRDILASWNQVYQSELEEASKLDTVESDIQRMPALFFPMTAGSVSTSNRCDNDGDGN